MKTRMYNKLRILSVFVVLFFFTRIELSKGQCIGDFALPAPSGINLSIPTGMLTDFAGQVMNGFNSVTTNPISIPVIGGLLPPITGIDILQDGAITVDIPNIPSIPNIPGISGNIPGVSVPNIPGISGNIPGIPGGIMSGGIPGAQTAAADLRAVNIGISIPGMPNLPGGFAIPSVLQAVGGFFPELNFTPPGNVASWIGALSSLFSGITICDLENMRKVKPTIPDMHEFWASDETTERTKHAEDKYKANVADPQFGLKAAKPIPNKGGAPIDVVIQNYIKTQLDAALTHLFPFQFFEPMGMVFVDAEIKCKPKIIIPFACITLPVCIPAGSSYNHVESVYNVHRPGHHALVPNVIVTPMMEAIKAIERATSNFLPFLVVAMNSMDEHGYWNSRNPAQLNNLASAMFMATQHSWTQKALEQYNLAQDKSGLLMPFSDDSFTVTSMPSVLSSGSPPGFGTLPIQFFGNFFLKKRSFILSGFPLHPFVKTWKDEYHAGQIHSDDINPIQYFASRSAIPQLLNLDASKYREVILNDYILHGNMLGVSQSQEHKKDSKWRYNRLPENTGGALMQDETAPEQQKKKAWLNPLSGNGCVSFRGKAIFPESTFANSTARVMCEVNQAIFDEQRNCKMGVGRCPGPRDSYWPYKQSPTVHGCSSEYSDFPDPEGDRAPHLPVLGNLFNIFGGGERYCMYDRYQLHNTHAAGIYNGSVLPEEMYPPDENDMEEKESPLVSHYHRQRDCMDEEVAKTIFPLFCGWERCDEHGEFEPAPNCVATNRFRPDIKVPKEGCL